MLNKLEPHVANARLQGDPLVEFGNARLTVPKERDHAKHQGEILRNNCLGSGLTFEKP